MLVAVSLLVVCFSYLAYKHPPALWSSTWTTYLIAASSWCQIEGEDIDADGTMGSSESKSEKADRRKREGNNKKYREEFLDGTSDAAPQQGFEVHTVERVSTPVPIPTVNVSEVADSLKKVVQESHSLTNSVTHPTYPPASPPSPFLRLDCVSEEDLMSISDVSFKGHTSQRVSAIRDDSIQTILTEPHRYGQLKPVANATQLTDSQLMPPPSAIPPIPAKYSKQESNNSLRSTYAAVRRVPNQNTPQLDLTPPAPRGSVNVKQNSGLARGHSELGRKNRVQLLPGHSDLDWAMRMGKGEDMSGVQNKPLYLTAEELKRYDGRGGRPMWSCYEGKIYNIEPYMDFHKGGEAEYRRAAGRDCTKIFKEAHDWVQWDNFLRLAWIGYMTGPGYGNQAPQRQALTVPKRVDTRARSRPSKDKVVVLESPLESID